MTSQTSADLGLATTEQEQAEQELALDLGEHQIGMVVPSNSLVRGEFLLSAGVVIDGTFCGRLVCSSGSVFIRHSAIFEGEVEADQVWIDGEVRPVSRPTAQIIEQAARSTPPAASRALAGLTATYKKKIAEGDLSRIVGRECVAISNAARGKADVASKSFAAHGSKFAARYLPVASTLAAA